MGAALSLLVLASPTLLVCGAFFLWRTKPALMRSAIALVIVTVWAVSIWYWISQSQQQTDVGIMVEGLIAMATTISAVVASLAGLICLRKA